MNRETTTFTSEAGDTYSVELIERNHNLVCVLPTITLSTNKIPPELFLLIAEHIISLNRDYIKEIYFDDIRIQYRFLLFRLFGHVRGALKIELRKPMRMTDLTSGADNYKWIESDFLPKIPEDLDLELYYLEKRIRNMYRAFRKGKVKGVPYVLPENYEIKYNYFFDLDPTDIRPVYDVYVTTSSPSTTGDPGKVSQLLLGKFESLNVKLMIK
jgi:hypothetical protein